MIVRHSPSPGPFWAVPQRQKMGEKKLVKVMQEYYTKVAKTPNAKTEEQLVG